MVIDEASMVVDIPAFIKKRPEARRAGQGVETGLK
jgi:hypothetical protein